MKIFLIGKREQLGADILRNNLHHEILTTDDHFFLEDGSCDCIKALLEERRPDVVINAAVFDDVPLCETDPTKAFAINCMAVRSLAGACSRLGVFFVTLSTDYVFDGEKKALYGEEDKPGPLQMYGISRLAGEFAALSAAPEHTMIVRSCGLYGMPGSGEGNFVDKRIEDALSQRPLAMGGDQVVSPTYTRDLGRALLQLIEHPRRRPGVYHLVNEGKCSWFEFTKAIYEIMGFTLNIKPVDRSGKSGDLRRPLYSALANTKARELGIILPSWRNALERYLVEKYER